MNAFKDRPKRDTEAAEEFAKGADMSTNTKSQEPQEKKQTKEPFYTTLQPRYKEIIQAEAYHDRISQREVVERALKAYYSGREEKLEESLKLYREQEEE